MSCVILVLQLQGRRPTVGHGIPVLKGFAAAQAGPAERRDLLRMICQFQHCGGEAFRIGWRHYHTGIANSFGQAVNDDEHDRGGSLR